MNGRAWTHRELAALRALYPKLKSVAIAARLGRTDRSVRTKATRMGLRTKAKCGSHDHRIRALWREGYCDWEIALAIDRTQQQVAQIRKRLGLPATRGRKPARGQKSPGLQTAGQSLILPEIVVSKI